MPKAPRIKHARPNKSWTTKTNEVARVVDCFDKCARARALAVDASTQVQFNMSNPKNRTNGYSCSPLTDGLLLMDGCVGETRHPRVIDAIERNRRLELELHSAIVTLQGNTDDTSRVPGLHTFIHRLRNILSIATDVAKSVRGCSERINTVVFNKRKDAYMHACGTVIQTRIDIFAASVRGTSHVVADTRSNCSLTGKSWFDSQTHTGNSDKLSESLLNTLDRIDVSMRVTTENIVATMVVMFMVMMGRGSEGKSDVDSCMLAVLRVAGVGTDKKGAASMSNTVATVELKGISRALKATLKCMKSIKTVITELETRAKIWRVSNMAHIQSNWTSQPNHRVTGIIRDMWGREARAGTASTF